VSAPTAAQLAAMRAAQAQLLPQSAAIARPLGIKDGLGTSTAAWPVVGVYACRVHETGHPEHYVAANLLSDRRAFVVTFAYGTDVQPEDRLTIGTLVLYVVGVINESSWQTVVRVLAQESK
jgi:head-tail adaptor